MSRGAIWGIALGITALIMIGIAALFYIKKRQASKPDEMESEKTFPPREPLKSEVSTSSPILEPKSRSTTYNPRLSLSVAPQTPSSLLRPNEKLFRSNSPAIPSPLAQEITPKTPPSILGSGKIVMEPLDVLSPPEVPLNMDPSPLEREITSMLV